VTAADAVAVALWMGVTLYSVFGGADCGTGLWDLTAGDPERGRPVRDLIDVAIGPVWEANHVWLIFCLVVLWSGFPVAFAAVASTLYIPLSLAALGIVLRGAGFAFRKATVASRGRAAFSTLFAVSSILTPFFLGTALGGIASGRVAPNQTGDLLTSWVNPTSALIGVLAVTICAYLAAVFLTIDAHRLGQMDLSRSFRSRALGAAIVAGAVSIAGIFVLRADAPDLYHGLTHEGLPFVIASVFCGAVVLSLLARGARFGTRLLAVGAVAAIVWGWGIAQYPLLLPPTLTIARGAAPEATLHALLIVVGVALAVVGPSLTLLFVMVQRDRLGAGASGARPAPDV
jgi:cytochrome d ubiquinol oxidase subunit II